MEPQLTLSEQLAKPSAPPEQPAGGTHGRRTTWLIVLALVLAAAVLAGIVFYLLQPQKIQSSIRTYFTYDQADISELSRQSTTATITIEDVQIWEDKAYELAEDHGTLDVDASKLYAYLTVAQMDAAALSLQAKGSFAGDIGPVSKAVLCEFYADRCASLMIKEDAYSQTLTKIVAAKVTARITEDNAQTKPSTLKAGSQYWQGPAPQIGISAPSFKPWFLQKADQFRAAPPQSADSAAAKQELATVKKMLSEATTEQKAIVVKWAGGPGTRTPPGIWLTLAADYMQAKKTPLDTYLETRAVLAMAMADSVISVFDSKYTYQSKRPNMLDPSIVTIMPTPNHPSYPAGHAAISWAAATVLSTLLPDNKQKWEQQAKEASDSRSIGGIHLPSDNAAGTTLGTNVGNQALKEWRE